MPFIPLTRKISWRNPPVVTIAIIVINVFVFFVIQSRDDMYEEHAHAFYFESGLDKIEIPLYVDFLKNHRPDAFNNYRKTEAFDADKNPSGKIMLYHSLMFDKEFLDRLKGGEIGPEDHFGKKNHRALRRDYEKRLNKIVSMKYGFRPAMPRMETWLTAMFLHGGTGHLVGNMVFLWLIGCLIEYGCRRWLFGILYVVGGFAATGLFWLLNMDSLVPLVGASGAISGIMGAFTVFYGFKRVRVFLSLGFYFNYLKFPAIVMLPIWIGNELFQMMTNEGSNVAYAAHLGGLFGGAALAFLLRRLPDLLDMEGFEDDRDDPIQPVLEKALEHMGRLEFSEARKLLAAANAEQPENDVILKHLFTIDRQTPGAPQFHHTTQQLLDSLCQRPETYSDAHKIYLEYIKAARPAKLGAAIYLQLCRVFCDIGKLDDSQRIISVLVKKRPNLKELPSLLLKLAGAHAKKGNRKSRQACLSYVCKRYPMSPEAQIAMQQLNLKLTN